MALFNRISLGNLRGDLFGGATAAVIALPMALAFGVASGAGAEAGLYGAILIGLFTALFGGTPTLISEPTGPMTVVFTAVIASLIAANPDQGLAMAFTVVMLTGVFQILFGLAKLGPYITMMPYSVVSGFMTGIGIVLIILQFPGLIGHATPEGGVIGTLQQLPTLVQRADPSELILGGLTLAILLATPAALKRVCPPQLVVLILGIVVVAFLLGQDAVRVVGAIDMGMPSPRLPVFTAEQWLIIVLDALVLALLGSVDAMLTSVVAASMTREQTDSNKELTGQGIGNLASGLFGGLPGSGATMGTVVNIQAGGRTALSGIARALILLIVVVWAGALTANIPLAVLAAIAVKVGLDIIDWRFLRRAHRVSLKGAFILYGVIGITVFVDLIVAVGFGLFIANVITIRRLADEQAESVSVLSGVGAGVTTTTGGAKALSESDAALLSRHEGRVKVLCLQGALVFGAASAIGREAPELADAQVLVIDLQAVPHLGVTTAVALESVIREALGNGAKVIMAGVQSQPRSRLAKMGLEEMLPDDAWVSTRNQALRQAGAALP